MRKTQLFNLKRNPNEFLAQHRDPKVVALVGKRPRPEQVNLADDPKHADTRARMEALLLAEMRRLHDPFRLWDQPQEVKPVAPSPQKKRKRSKKEKKK